MGRISNFKILSLFVFLIMLTLVYPINIASGEEQESQIDKIQWQQGPSIGDLGKIAEIRIPGGAGFAGAGDMKTIMEAGENIYSGDELGYLLVPYEESKFLEIYFQFDESGYIKDDEKGSLDTIGMLNTMKENNKEGNKERKKRGWKPLYIVDWEIPPHYDENTHNLEWATRLKTDTGEEIINYNTRLLGRTGVMRVTLVAPPEDLRISIPAFQEIISEFSYKQGYRYAEYRQGDKLAKYGLSALVVGGAAAVAAKSGLLKGLWKLIVAAGIGIVAFFKKIFGRKTTA